MLTLETKAGQFIAFDPDATTAVEQVDAEHSAIFVGPFRHIVKGMAIQILAAILDYDPGAESDDPVPGLGEVEATNETEPKAN